MILVCFFSTFCKHRGFQHPVCKPPLYTSIRDELACQCFLPLVQMDALPGCSATTANSTDASGLGAAPTLNPNPAMTCGAWLTMRRTAEYDKKLRRVEAEGEAPEQALPQQEQQALPQIKAQ